MSTYYPMTGNAMYLITGRSMQSNFSKSNNRLSKQLKVKIKINEIRQIISFFWGTAPSRMFWLAATLWKDCYFIFTLFYIVRARIIICNNSRQYGRNLYFYAHTKIKSLILNFPFDSETNLPNLMC